MSYMIEKVIGNGSFGTVYSAFILETSEKIVIKRVIWNSMFKNREYSNHMLCNGHPNIVKMKSAFYTMCIEIIFLNFVLEYVPLTLQQFIKQQSKKQIQFHQIKIIIYQILRGLSFMHCINMSFIIIQAKQLVHRDIKPQNILMNGFEVKICDLGSAKIISKDKANVAYLCSRHYRAPELIFGATQYTQSIDIWSLGCLISEMILLKPLFPGKSSVDQLFEIMKVLGSPKPNEIQEFNLLNSEYFKFPQVKAHSWSKVFMKCKPNDQLVSLIKRMVVYSPQNRINANDALQDPYFDDISKCYEDLKIPFDSNALALEEIHIQ